MHPVCSRQNGALGNEHAGIMDRTLIAYESSETLRHYCCHREPARSLEVLRCLLVISIKE